MLSNPQSGEDGTAREDRFTVTEASLIEKCERKLSQYYRIISVVIGGSRADIRGNGNDLDLCVVVSDNVLSRARLRICRTPVDVFIGSEERFSQEITRGAHVHLMTLFRSCRSVSGDKSVIDRLQRLAKETALRKAPEPAAGTLFRYRTQPYDLLQKFQRLYRSDPAAASFLIATLVRVCVDAYFSLNRLWTAPVHDAVRMNPGDLVVNEQGGAQSALHGSPRLIPPEALLKLGEIVAEGATKYAENNWRKIPFEEHLSHALEHIFLYMNADRGEDHIGHALCRMAFAVAMQPPEGFDFKEWRPLKDTP